MVEKKTIRVAQIMGKWLGGGVESVIMNYYRHIDRNKIQFDFICDEDSTDIPYEDIKKLGGKVILIPPYQNVFKYHKELKKVLKEENYEIVHSHINTLSVFSLFAAKCAGVQVRIAHSHSTTNKKEKKKNLIKQALRPFSKLFATDYMCCSELSGRWLFGNNEYDKGNVYLLNNAIEVEKFKYNEQARKNKRKELNIKDDTIVIGHVGRFVEQKNHRFLIDIFNEVHKQNNNSILLLVGQGPLIDEMKEKVKKLKLENSVKFLGQRNDVNELYQAMDLFLFPSLYEGLGMAVIEAQYANLPCVVSTEVPYIAKINEYIEFVGLSTDINKWVDTIKNFLYTKSINRNTEKIKNTCYDINKEAKKLEKIYLKNDNNLIRILQMGMTDNLGGIESYLINYYRHIDRNKIQFDFTNIYPNKLCFQDEMKEMGAKIYKISNYYKHPIKYIIEVIKIIKNNKYEIVHCNMNSAVMIFPLIAAKLAGTKVIIAHAHNNSSDKGVFKSFFHSLNKHFIPLFANKYFACSNEAGQWFFSKKIIESDNFVVIQNGIDKSKFRFDGNLRIDTRRKFNINKSTFVVGHVGRFEKQKNHTFLIDIFNEIVKKNKDSMLILVGVGSLQDQIKLKVKKMKLENKVLFLNNRDDVYKIMNAMDVFVLPSLYEGLGIVLVEAQYSGLPIVTTNKIPNIVKITNNYTSLSLNEKPNIWAKKILEFRTNNRKNIQSNIFDIDICSNKLKELYLESVGEINE